MSRPTSAPPFGWQTSKSQHHLRLVFPRNPNCMYNKIHKNLNPKLKRKDTEKEKDKTDDCIKILYKQRTVRRAFSAQTRRPKNQLLEATNRLAHFNPSFKPAESDRSTMTRCTSASKARNFPSPYNKPLYSKEEVQSIVNRLHQSKHPDSTLKLRKPKNMYTAISLENIVATIQRREGFDKCPMSHPLKDVETCEHVQRCSKKYSAADVQEITDRISRFDTMKWPPMSKNKKARESDAPKPPPPVDYVPPRKYTSKEVAEITERMHKFNPEKWPPNSKAKPKEDIHSTLRTYSPVWRRKGEKAVLPPVVVIRTRDLSDTEDEEDDDNDDDGDENNGDEEEKEESQET